MSPISSTLVYAVVIQDGSLGVITTKNNAQMIGPIRAGSRASHHRCARRAPLVSWQTATTVWPSNPASDVTNIYEVGRFPVVLRDELNTSKGEVSAGFRSAKGLPVARTPSNSWLYRALRWDVRSIQRPFACARRSFSPQRVGVERNSRRVVQPPSVRDIANCVRSN